MVRSGVPREFVWSAPVWQADLDAFGELRNANLVRLLQETATRASSDAGFDGGYYARTGTMWIIRRTTLSLARAARYGDVLTVRTWIADFRRVRSLRAYEVRSADRLIARATTDWVLVDAARGRPRRIPDEWEAVFAPTGADAAQRAPFPERAPSPHAATRTRRVELHDLDALRHVNNANYVSYVEQGVYDLAAAGSIDLDAQIAAGGRLRAVHHDLEYLDEARMGEHVSVTTWTTDVTPDELTLHTHLHRGDATRPLLHAHSRYRWTVDGEDAALPDALRAVFAAV